MQVKIKEIGKTTNACMRRSPDVRRAAVIAGSPGPEHYCSLVAGSSLFTTGHWKSLSTPFLEPNSKCLMRQECRHDVKSKKKIKANYSIWCLKPSKVQQNPFGVTRVYNLYFLKKTANPRRWQRRQCRAHSTWNVLAASQCVLLNSPHPAQGHTKSFCLQRKTKVNYERNGMGIY